MPKNYNVPAHKTFISRGMAIKEATDATILSKTGYVNFENTGYPCLTGCKGWDGVSTFCDCGAKRVSWTTYLSVNGGFGIKAESRNGL